jgi:hypothetical protein
VLDALIPGWRIWGALALLAAAAGGLLWWRHDIGAKATAELRREIAESNERRRREVAEYVVDMNARNSALADELRVERGREKTITQTLIKEVTRHVTPLADSRCVVPHGFVLHHDAAWRGSTLPAAPGGSVDAPSGIPLSRVESVNTENAGACRELLAEVRGWRRWYPDHKARYDALAARWNAQSRGAEGQPEALPRKER